jgi:ankyrin repeat protein
VGRARLRLIRVVAAALALGCAAAGGASSGSLVEAAKTGDGTAALALLDTGADVNAPSDDGTTALHWAAYHDDVPLARRLIEAGADANAENDYGATPLSQAAAIGDARMIELLLDAGADVESPNPNGETALMRAARTNHVDGARLLIEHGADVNHREGWRGQTALMWAAAEGQPEMIRLLLEHGAEPDVRSAPNHWARQVSAESRRMYRPTGGLTPLLYAAREGCVACARALVEGGADPDFTNPKNVTPLYMAIDNMHFDTAKYLIEAGANVNMWDWWGRSALYGAVDMVTVPAGGRPDRRTTDETSALELVELLLEHGANPNLQLKLSPPYRSIVDDRGCDSMLTTGMTPLLRAAKTFDADAMRLLIAHGARLDLPNQDGIMPIMAAAGLGSSVCDPRGYGPGIPHYQTPDVQQASIAALKVLLDAGADVNVHAPQVSVPPSRFGGRRYGQTALHGAAQWGWNDVVSYLVERGARIDIRDARGRTPLDAALGRLGGRGRGDNIGPHEATAKLLRELCAEQAGCDPQALAGPSKETP